MTLLLKKIHFTLLNYFKNKYKSFFYYMSILYNKKMSLNHLLNPTQGQTLNIVVNSVRSDGPLITKCTTDGKELDLTPPTIGNIGDVLTRVGTSGNVEFMPPSGSGGTVTNPLNSNLSIGAFDVVGLFGGQTLSSIGSTQILQTQTINDSADKVQNINNFTIPNLTVFDGIVRSDNLGADIVGDKLFLSKINLNTNTINIETDNLKFNGNPIATIGDIQTTTLSSVGTGDSIVYQDVGPSLSVKSLLQGGGIQIFSSGNTIEISSTDQPRITTLETKTQNQSAILNDTTFSGIIQADTLKKVGGTNNQYLMADGSSLQYSANSGNSNFYLYKSHVNTPPLPVDDGFVFYNNSVQASATFIYVSHRTEDNIDIEVFFNNISQLNDVYLQQKSQSNNFIRYNITGSPVIYPTQYIAIPVTIMSSGGIGATSFGINEPILLSFFTNSLEIDTRISAVENKTQNISLAGATFTTFSGINGIYAQDFVKQGTTDNDIMLGNGSIYSLSSITAPLFSVQIKTQNQTTDNFVSTTFTGTNGIISNKYVKSGGLTTQFLKANGDSDATSYIPSTGLNTNLLLADGSTTNLSRITNLETKTAFQSIVSGNTSFSSGLVLNGPITKNGASNIDIMSMDRPYFGIQYVHNSGSLSTQSNSLWTYAGSTTSTPAPYATTNNVTRQLGTALWSFPTPSDGQICGCCSSATTGAQVCTGFPFGLIFLGNIADTGHSANNCQNVFGLWSSATPASLNQSTQLSTRTNLIVFGSNTTDPNICIYTCGALAANNSKHVDLGSSFPANRPSANASTDWLKLALWWDGATTMYYKAVNETLNVTVTGSFNPTSAQIPIPTFTLYPQCCRIMGTPSASGQGKLIVKRFGVF